MDASVVGQEYSSSLEDLTFNSKPLINMLTMLAEENSQHATEIVKLIEERIYRVTIEQKLPSLYLMDSIVKNVGKAYRTAVTQCIVALFTHVFEKGDEKVRMSLYKLRNTWPPVIPAKKLHEIDCSVHKLDPGWPVVNPPPVSPSIHINPKFLTQVEEDAASSDAVDIKVIEDFERKQKELKNLQGEQMRLQMQEITELQLKHDLIKKKQEQERQKLIKQQKEQILQMRLREENIIIDPTETKKNENVSTNPFGNSRDPRLVKLDPITVSKTGSTDVRYSPKGEQEKADILEKDNGPIKKSKKVGFDTEFVPLDSDKGGEDSTSDTAYNRDRPLGNKRYFRKKTSNKDDNTEHKTKHRASHVEISKESDGGVKRLESDVHPRDKNLPFEKDNDQKQKKNRRREQDGDRKASARGRQRNRKHDRNSRYNEVEKHPHVEDMVLDDDKELMQVDSTSDLHGRQEPGKKIFRGSRRGRAPGRDRRNDRNRHEPGGVENYERPPERPGRKWQPGDHTFEKGILGEPPSKKTRNSPPRPLFSEDEISKIRDRHRNSPPPRFGVPQDIEHHPPPPNWRKERGRGPGPDFHPRWRPEQGHRMKQPEFHNQPFPLPERPPRFPHPQGLPRHPDFQRSNFAGGVEIPLELTLDNESRILQSAQHRLRSGDLSEEQYRELLEKLHQLYELQKWQRSHSLSQSESELPPPSHPSLGHRLVPNPPEPANHHQGFPIHPVENIVIEERLSGRRDLPPLQQPPINVVDEHLAPLQPPPLPPQPLPPQPLPPQVPPRPLPPQQLPPQTQLAHPRMPLHEHGPPLQGPQLPPSQLPRQLPQPSQLPPQLPPQSQLPPSHLPPSQLRPPSQLPPVEAIENQNKQSQAICFARDQVPPCNLVMEKQTVDDLFKRLMNFGIITKIAQEPSQGRPMIPPVKEIQKILIPEINLKNIRSLRRYDGVITQLYRGTQCSSCGLRFKQTDNELYRQHLDWHFRMNRKEKETVAAHRNWFITEDDWLEFESSEDPKLKARSSVFEAESDNEQENSEDDTERSCPVLRDDTESESACDICLEKFEQFWDETSEDWHYKDAVRIDGKTYHYLCYQDAGEEDNVEEDTEATTDESESKQEVDNVAVKSEDDNEQEDEVIKDISFNTDNTSNVTQNTELGGELGVDDANKEEIKTECC